MSLGATTLPRSRGTATLAEAPWVVLCLGLAAITAAAILLPPYPPLQDVPEWAYQGQLLARWLRGLPIDGIGLATTPVPNSSVQLLLGLLSLAMPPALAARLLLLGLLLGSLALALALGRRWQNQAPAAFAAVLLVAVFLGTGFWNGYVNFQLGMLILGGWFLLPERRQGEAPAILLASLALFFTHAMVFAAFGVLLGVTALLQRRLRATILGLLPAAILAAWYILAGTGGNAEATRGGGGLASFVAYKLYTLAKLGPYHNFVFAEGGDAALRPLLHRIGVAANLVFTAGLALALLLGLRRALRPLPAAPSTNTPLATTPSTTAPLVTAGVLLAAFAVLPDLVLNVVNPGERLMLPALLILLLVLPLPPWLVRGLGLGAVLLAATVLLLVATPHNWAEPLHWTQVEGQAELFRHRPTAFSCKWSEMLRATATGEMPRQPLSFGTSLLVVDQTYAGCTGRPG